LGEWIQVCSNKADSASPRGDNSERKNTLNISPKPAGQIQSYFTQIISEGNSSLFK
jgi:hypothetical protein